MKKLNKVDREEGRRLLRESATDIVDYQLNLEDWPRTDEEEIRFAATLQERCKLLLEKSERTDTMDDEELVKTLDETQQTMLLMCYAVGGEEDFTVDIMASFVDKISRRTGYEPLRIDKKEEEFANRMGR